MILPTQLSVAISEAHIALGERGSTTANPVALALSEAVHAHNPDSSPTLSVFRGSSMAPNHSDETRNADAYFLNIRWHALLYGQDVPLPIRCQIFLDVWEYGPGGGAAYAIRDATGVVIARRTFCEIIVPFSFALRRR